MRLPWADWDELDAGLLQDVSSGGFRSRCCGGSQRTVEETIVKNRSQEERGVVMLERERYLETRTVEDILLLCTHYLTREYYCAMVTMPRAGRHSLSQEP